MSRREDAYRKELDSYYAAGERDGYNGTVTSCFLDYPDRYGRLAYEAGLERGRADFAAFVNRVTAEQRRLKARPATERRPD